MPREDNGRFVLVKGPKRGKFLCPIDAGQDPASIRIDESDDCFEEDVAGRYAGNINIERS